VSAQDLGPEHLILYSIPPEANLVFREVLIPAGVRPKRVTHIQLTEAIVEMVKADLAVSVLPRWSVAPAARARRARRAVADARRPLPSWSAAWRRRDPRRRSSTSSSSWRGTRSRSAARRGAPADRAALGAARGAPARRRGRLAHEAAVHDERGAVVNEDSSEARNR
jgi:hypothetical protein